jgi:hypothetical protein
MLAIREAETNLLNELKELGLQMSDPTMAEYIQYFTIT